MSASDRAMNVSRRSTLFGLAAGTFLLAARFAPPAQAQAKKYGGEGMPGGVKDDPRIFLSIGDDGTVTLLCHRAEMGQGVRTSWAMVVADELDADSSRLRVVQSPGDQARFGNQNTDGSRSMRHHFWPLRRIAASARQMLEQEAASRWDVPASELHAEQHDIVHRASGRRVAFGELAQGAAKRVVPPPDQLKFKSSDRFQYIGKASVPLVDNNDITVGKALYGIDARIDGMAYAVIARPPAYGGKVKSFEAADVLKVPGVLKVIEMPVPTFPSGFQPLGGVAIVAENTFAAIKGRSALKVTWDDGPNRAYDSAKYRQEMEAASRKPSKVVRTQGDVDAAMAKANRRVSASYYIPHVAHVPIEPPTATARTTADGCEIWCSVQAPEAIRTDLTKRFGMAPDKIAINGLLIGGGFGRKSKPDFAIEAAILSRAMDGRAVKVTFTREDDLQNGYLNTVSVERLEAGLDPKGMPTAWLHRTVAPSISALFMQDPKHQGPIELAQGAVDMPLAVPNIRVENPPAEAHTRVGWFRSVFNIPHAFAIQSFVSELAAAAKRDPKDYLLELLGPDRLIGAEELADQWVYGEDPQVYPFDTGRLRRAVEAVAKEAGWGRKLPPGHGLGIAAHRSFVSYAAVVVEAAVSPAGELSIPSVHIALDCGAAINPDRIRSQLEGSVIQGISLATTGEITFKEGRVEQTNFHEYELLRMDAAPSRVFTHILTPTGYDRPLGGVGEPGLPPVAPALTNAIFAASGKRIRALPVAGQLAPRRT